VLLDAPRYFFVSTNVSLKFPALLESAIIQSFHTYYPSEAPWAQGISQDSSPIPWWLWNTRARAGKSFMTSTLQYLGASSPTAQRVFIHLIQPLFVSSIVYLWVVLIHRPVLFAPLGFLVLLCIARSCHSRRAQRELQSQESEIHPIDSPVTKPPAPPSELTAVAAQPTLLSDRCEEKADDCEEKASDLDQSSLAEPSVSGEDGSLSIMSGDFSSTSDRRGERPSSLSSGWNPPPCHRYHSDRSLAASIMSSIDSPMELSDPDSESSDELSEELSA
jgi:hypothetical protein